MMDKKSAPVPIVQLAAYWLVVGLPLAWGIWKTLTKLPALFQN
jgi:hypothetical protein